MPPDPKPRRFRKKPVVVEAVRFDYNMTGFGICRCNDVPRGGQPHIHTLEGYLSPTIGDWIIRGVKGEFYPCKPDTFEATYEPAD